MDNTDAAPTVSSLWACPRCRAALPADPPASDGATFPLKVGSRLVHESASLEKYASVCPNCALPYTATSERRFDYPYRQLLAEIDTGRFLRWSAAQNNGFVSYALMRGSSCSIDGRPDAERFAEFIRQNVKRPPASVLDIGCGPLAIPAYLPSFHGAKMIGLDPFDSEFEGAFIHGASEFLPLRDSSVDLVVTATALDHTLDVRAALNELARVTRSGGSLAVWDHTFPAQTAASRWTRFVNVAVTVLSPRYSWRDKVTLVRSLLPERIRVYDNGLVLWTPQRYADPFHEPQSRRPSWTRKLQKVIATAGFVETAADSTWGFSYYIRN